MFVQSPNEMTLGMSIAPLMYMRTCFNFCQSCCNGADDTLSYKGNELQLADINVPVYICRATLPQYNEKLLVFLCLMVLNFRL